MTALDDAEAAYHAAAFGGDTSTIAACLADLTGGTPQVELARGKLLHFVDPDTPPGHDRELDCFRRAEAGFRADGDDSGVAQALFWQGCYQQVRRRDDAAAVPLLQDGLALARSAEDPLTASYCLRHLGIAAHRGGDVDTAEQRLSASTELRRELGFGAGIAANLVGLAFVAVARGDRDLARRRAQEALDTANAVKADKVADDARSALAAVRG